MPTETRRLPDASEIVERWRRIDDLLDAIGAPEPPAASREDCERRDADRPALTLIRGGRDA